MSLCSESERRFSQEPISVDDIIQRRRLSNKRKRPIEEESSDKETDATGGDIEEDEEEDEPIGLDEEDEDEDDPLATSDEEELEQHDSQTSEHEDDGNLSTHPLLMILKSKLLQRKHEKQLSLIRKLPLLRKNIPHSLP